MSFVNKEKILNANPLKRLLIGYEKLKENFTEEAAYSYMSLYKDQPLSFLLENSELIFKEPYYGYDFYKTLMEGENVEYPLFHQYDIEKGKVQNYLDQNKEKMSIKQAEMYEDLLSCLKDQEEKFKNCKTVCGYLQGEYPQLNADIPELCDDLYDYNKCCTRGERDIVSRKIKDKMCNIPNSAYNLYAPFVNRATHDPSLIARSDMEEIKDASVFRGENYKSEFESYIESVFLVSKLFDDAVYEESVREVPNVTIRSIFTGYHKESAREQINNIVTEHVSQMETFYASPKASVNKIFNDVLDDAIYEEEFREAKEYCLGLQKIAYDKLSDIILYEYLDTTDLESPVSSYSFFSENTTVEEAMQMIIEKVNEINNELSYISEEEENDFSDDRYIEEKLEVRTNPLTGKKYFRQVPDENGKIDVKKDVDLYVGFSNYMNEKSKDSKNFDIDKEFEKYEKEFEEKNKEDNKASEKADKEVDKEAEKYEPKKVDAPKPKNLSNKIQFKAQDAEVKQMKKMGEKELKGQERKNALKAVAQLPKNIIDNIKKQIHKVDEKDDERRIKYMTEPGFRKKAFRNLKLAIMYGSAAQIKLAFVPITALTRHFSKEKDRRIRNELLNKLETEIKICDEKINDANSEGDKNEKYQLMRIKAKLERERLRVRTNSRYI